MTHSIPYPAQRGDAQLWLTAFAVAGVFYVVFLILLGLAFIQWNWFSSAAVLPPPEANAAATIYIEAPQPEAVAKMLESPKQKFSRTSPDQEAPKRDEKSELIGERNTRATSDRPADPTAKVMPSQDGVEPKDEQEIETTESDYQDGKLTDSSSKPVVAANDAPPVPPSPAESLEEQSSGIKTELPGTDAEESVPPLREQLLDGPNPVEVHVPKEEGVVEEPKPKLQRPKPEEALPKSQDTQTTSPSEQPKPKEFSGFQRKTAVVGSISRTGRSALNVDDTALGRYQATISKAVEQEWQRNCVRHRDFITPGFLTVRFFVETNGKVKSVQFVGEMETGEIQKGFTLNSIRDAEIPAMPDDLKPVYEDDSLELIFRFYF